MLKFISVSLFCLMCLSTMSVSAKDNTAVNKTEAKSNYTYDAEENFNFNDNSYNISDEQLENASNRDVYNDLNERQSFMQRIINSSHFSSGTATQTYVPVNKSL